MVKINKENKNKENEHIFTIIYNNGQRDQIHELQIHLKWKIKELGIKDADGRKEVQW